LLSDPNAAKRLAKCSSPCRRNASAVIRLRGQTTFWRHYALAGNATEFLDPVFSSGVTLALASSQSRGQNLIRQLRGEPVDWQADYADHVMQGINTFRAYVSAWYDGKLPQIFFAAQRNPTSCGRFVPCWPATSGTNRIPTSRRPTARWRR
jgi:flavin-dependent dehydrogenase